MTGLFLGGAIGILQDALSHDNPIGMYGIAKTHGRLVASSIGARIDTEHPLSRFGLVFCFFHFHQIVLAITQRVLLNHSAPLFTLRLFLDSLVTAAFAVRCLRCSIACAGLPDLFRGSLAWLSFKEGL